MFSSQSCSLKFGSWTYDAWRVDIVTESSSGDTKTTQVSGEWDLVEFPCKRNVEKYECCPEPYSDVTCTLKLRRRTTYFFVNLIVPCFLITRKSNLPATDGYIYVSLSWGTIYTSTKVSRPKATGGYPSFYKMKRARGVLIPLMRS